MGFEWMTPWQDFWTQYNGWSWRPEFAFVPHKTESDKWVWLRKVYHGIRVIHGPGTPVTLHQYMTPAEFTWFQLHNA